VIALDSCGSLGVVMTNASGFQKGGGAAVDHLLQSALTALRSQCPNEAEQIATDILKGQPRHPRALYVLGSALLMQGRFKEAIPQLEDAGRGRHDPEIDTLLAIALRQTGRSEAALLKLKRATKRKPPYPMAFHELGYLLFSLERYDEAIETFNRGLEVAPTMPELLVQLGYVHLRRKNWCDAKMAFARALIVSPASHDALRGLAMAQSEGGEYGPAAEAFRRCLISRPDDANLWLSLGHCLLALGQSEAGFNCFRAAARGDPARTGLALSSLVRSSRGRFWLKPSEATRFLRVKPS
jgi:Flp pilus assembly protein TadD